MLDMILARMKEPSSYAGIAALLGVVGYNVDPGLMQNVMDIGAGLTAFFKKG